MRSSGADHLGRRVVRPWDLTNSWSCVALTSPKVNFTFCLHCCGFAFGDCLWGFIAKLYANTMQWCSVSRLPKWFSRFPASPAWLCSSAAFCAVSRINSFQFSTLSCVEGISFLRFLSAEHRICLFVCSYFPSKFGLASAAWIWFFSLSLIGILELDDFELCWKDKWFLLGFDPSVCVYCLWQYS